MEASPRQTSAVSEVRVTEREWARQSTCTLFLTVSTQAEGSEASMPCSVAFPSAAQLEAQAYCISGRYWPKRKYIILSKQQIILYRCSLPPSQSSPPHTNSSNRYRLSAYFSHSSISNACVKGALIYVYQLCGALLLGNVIVLMVFLLYSKVANEAYCKKVIDFH